MKQILGRVSKKIALDNNIPEHSNKPIVLYDNDKRHCKKHMDEFPSKESFYYVMTNLDYIISNPDEVFYVKAKDTLEYYKFFDELGITIRVKVEPGRELKMKTLFPVKQTKLENKRKNRDYNKYVVGIE